MSKNSLKLFLVILLVLNLNLISLSYAKPYGQIQSNFEIDQAQKNTQLEELEYGQKRVITEHEIILSNITNDQVEQLVKQVTANTLNQMFLNLPSAERELFLSMNTKCPATNEYIITVMTLCLLSQLFIMLMNIVLTYSVLKPKLDKIASNIYYNFAKLLLNPDKLKQFLINLEKKGLSTDFDDYDELMDKISELAKNDNPVDSTDHLLDKIDPKTGLEPNKEKEQKEKEIKKGAK